MGIVSNIQRFSLSDGDGIRTTVFLKGCNMKCEWCHNPETISKNPELMFYEAKCIGCGKCFETCPNGAQKIVDKKHIIDRSLCTECGKCADICYAEALVMCGKEMSVRDVMKEIRQDIEYYKSSDGGVTISGGEVLCQKEYAKEICKACHNEKINVAIETNLSFTFDYAKDLLLETDLIMCDIKIFDDESHIEHTGVSNKIVLENIKKVDLLGIPVIVRTPLIPGVTDGTDNISNITNYIKGMKNLKRYEVLNFNPLGEGKYKSMGKENKFEKCRPFTTDGLEYIEKILTDAGIPFKIV